MLKGLRKKFVAIVMALVGAVLVAVLGSTYLATYQTQRSIITSSLSRSLYENLGTRPQLGLPQQPGAARIGGMLCLTIEVDSAGNVIRSNNVPVSVDSNLLGRIVEGVVSGSEASGIEQDSLVEWASVRVDGYEAYGDYDDIYDDDDDDYDDDDAFDEDYGLWRIAIVDTSASDQLLQAQAIKDVQIVLVALAALFAIAWWLSGWALRPVEQAWEQQQRFVADASHELKTPLAVILANTQILEGDKTIGEDAMRWVRSTSEEAQHMKTLVGDLLQLARADERMTMGTASNALHREDIDFSELVESVALEFDAVAFERGCSLKAEVAEGIHLQGDKEWIARLTRILIDNACKYAQKETTVTARLARAAGHATLTVHNLGNPIDEQDLPHVFERFYRTDKARSRQETGGFGLGLAIAKSIVDAHGGTIAVSSSANEGTTFTVTL